MTAAGDSILRHSLFWMLFLPVNERFALDLKYERYTHVNREPRVLTTPGVGAIFQCAALYMFSCFHKSYTGYVVNKTVVNDILQMEHYASQDPGLLPSFLLSHPYLMRFLSASTVVVELMGSIVMLVPIIHPQLLRFIGVLATASLQVGFMLCLHLGTFPFCSLSLGIPVLPFAFWDMLFPEPRLREKKPVSTSSQTAKLCLIEMLGCILIIVMALSNIQFLRRDGDLMLTNTSGLRLPNWILPVHNFFGLKQIWNMFPFKATDPSVTGRMIVAGHLGSRKILDLQIGSRIKFITDSRWSQEIESTKVYPNFHWRAYALYLFGEDRLVLHEHAMKFWCYKHNVLERNGCRYHNSPTEVKDRLEFVELWRITYHVERNMTKVTLAQDDLDKFKTEQLVLVWNCLENREYSEQDDRSLRD